MHRDENRSFETRALSILRPAADATMTLRTAIWSSRRMLRRLLCVLAVFTTFFALGVAGQAAFEKGRHSGIWMESKERAARNMVRVVAGEGYARWSMNNPGKRCPDSAFELAKYLDDREMRDPWGTSYVMQCGDASTYGMRVVSAGQDGEFGTPDDIRSSDDVP